MVTIPFLELEQLLAVEIVNNHTDYVSDVVARKTGEQTIGGRNFSIDTCPDWLLVQLVHQRIIGSATQAQVPLGPGEININGETYEEVIDKYDPNNQYAHMPDLSLCGKFSLPGMILGELTRRLECAMAQDNAQINARGWEPPEFWGEGENDDTPPIDG